jgi:hypothetical protein
MLVAGIFAVGRLAITADEKKGPPDEKVIAEAMAKAATPGEAHKKIAFMAGSWELTVTMYMDPTKPNTSKATSEIKWVMGNRYLEEKVNGDFMGMPFHGQGWLGYDNLRQTYVGAWIDNMATGIARSTGTLSTDGKTLEMKGEEIDPVTGKKVATRDVMSITDNDNYTGNYYRTMEGTEIKVMSIVYKRKK